MKLQISNKEQLNDLSVLAILLGNLMRAIENYNNILDSKEYYEAKYKRPGAAEEYYLKDLGVLKSNVETEVNFVNASLLSLGMETITIEY